MAEIHPIIVPKWGLEMDEGRLLAWLVHEGQTVQKGDELVEIETSKVTNVFESTSSGVFRRKVGELDKVYACGTLIGVIADPQVSEEDIDRFIGGYSVLAKQQASAPTGPTAQNVMVRGVSLRYLQQGEGGIPILFIHGFGGDLNNWLLLQPAMAIHRATYAVDLPGHGRSSKDLSPFSNWDDIADLLIAFLDAQNIDAVHLVAHSMGASIALAMARRAENRVETITLLAPAGLGQPVREQFTEGLIAARNRKQVSDVLKCLFANPDSVTRELVDEMLRFKRLDGVEIALAKYAEFLKREHRSQEEPLHGISQPVTIVWGRADKVIPPAGLRSLPKQNVRLVLLEYTGHMPHTEQSAATIEAASALVERESNADRSS